VIDRYINLDFIRAKLKDSYSDTGRPSIDPELLLRMLLIGYLYGVTSERKLVEELRISSGVVLVSRDWASIRRFRTTRRFPRTGMDDYRNRHLFQELFEEIVARCVEAGIGEGRAHVVDGSFIQANADHHSHVPASNWRK
jgi:transposase